MNRTTLRWLVLVVSSSALVGLAVKACSNPELVETLGEKHEWSILQSIEVQTRDDPLSEPVVRKALDDDILGVKGASGSNIWIMLKPGSPPYYKQLSEGQYDLPAAMVERLNREHRLSYTVSAVLRSHVREIATPAGRLSAAPRPAPPTAIK